MRVGDLATRFDMSLNAVSKHIKQLEAAGLVKRHTQWRDHVITADLNQLHLVEAWFEQVRSHWTMRLENLANTIKQKRGE